MFVQGKSKLRNRKINSKAPTADMGESFGVFFTVCLFGVKSDELGGRVTKSLDESLDGGSTSRLNLCLKFCVKNVFILTCRKA